MRFSASGSVRDFNQGGVFVGHSYAALIVRVVVGTNNVLSPGPVRFLDNAGKIRVAKARPVANSFEWVGELGGTSNLKTVKVQVANLNTSGPGRDHQVEPGGAAPLADGHAEQRGQTPLFRSSTSCRSRTAHRGPVAVSSCLK